MAHVDQACGPGEEYAEVDKIIACYNYLRGREEPTKFRADGHDVLCLWRDSKVQVRGESVTGRNESASG